MRKLFYFLLVAVVLGMASCNENEPEKPAFQVQFQTATLTDAVHLIVTPADNEAEYFYWIIDVKTVIEAGSLEAYVQKKVAVNTYQKWKNGGFILSGPEDIIIDHSVDDILRYNNRYYVYACQVEPDEEGAVKIISKIASQEFWTMPYCTLPGVFSVGANKTVVFATSNYVKTDYGFSLDNDQWYYLCQSEPTTPYDLHQWISGNIRFNNDFYIPSADEWWYLFKDRPRADELFAHATVNDVHGLILLPDNWQIPKGITLTTSKEMGFTWDENSKAYGSSVNGYARNKYTAKQWQLLEFAGAVFLPAAGSNGINGEIYGWYWSSSESADKKYAHAVCISGNELSLYTLKGGVAKANTISVRFVRVVDLED